VTKSDADLETLVEHLKRNRGFDFTGYKRASLERRVAKRMSELSMPSFAEYLDHLEVHPDEFANLFNTILINVTAFFRDASTWDFLRDAVIPELIAANQPGFPIRVWSAGCASGEEAFTLAMLFAEALGIDRFRETVKIYATDVDDEALAKARLATYSARDVEGIPADLLDKYFEPVDNAFVFVKDVRRQVIFGRHDLIQDAPISRVDLLTCRNTLMYFNAETQAKILARLQFALNDNGVLVLGRAETLMAHASAFAPLDVKRRVSRKLPTHGPGHRERLLRLVQATADGGLSLDLGLPLRTAALDAIPTAQILIDAGGSLAMANERARTVFGLLPTDLGAPIQDLKISYRPVELRAAIDSVMADAKPVIFHDVEWSFAGDQRWFEVQVSPLLDSDGVALGASVAYQDVTVAKQLYDQLEHSNQELETAYEELQSTNEELETTNEELQSTVEELETTNEELQSTNEELETMNEELQSTNEELQTMNDEIRLRSEDLNHANAFLESILESLSGAVVVVDTELMVLVWNEGATELWGLREDETRGKNVLGLDIGLPVERLKAPIRSCLGGGHEQAVVALDAVNRRGRAVKCVVTVKPLRTRSRSILGAILSMEIPRPDAHGNGDGNGHDSSEPAPMRLEQVKSRPRP
jgi:two-component system, chemotaxis family, CheB/CheR fusion protein